MIELITVIVILGILAAFAIPKFIDISSDAEKASVKQFVAALTSAGNLAFAQFFVCGHYLSQPNQLHLGSFVKLSGPAQSYAACPDPFSNGSAAAIDVESQRANLLANPGADMMFDNPNNGDHVQFVTKTGRTIDIIFNPANRQITWTANPVY